MVETLIAYMLMVVAVAVTAGFPKTLKAMEVEIRVTVIRLWFLLFGAFMIIAFKPQYQPLVMSWIFFITVWISSVYFLIKK